MRRSITSHSWRSGRTTYLIFCTWSRVSLNTCPSSMTLCICVNCFVVTCIVCRYHHTYLSHYLSIRTVSDSDLLSGRPATYRSYRLGCRRHSAQQGAPCTTSERPHIPLDYLSVSVYVRLLCCLSLCCLPVDCDCCIYRAVVIYTPLFQTPRRRT